MAIPNEQSKGSTPQDSQKSAQAAQPMSSPAQGQSQAAPGFKKDAVTNPTDKTSETASDAQAKSAPVKSSTEKLST